jgi:hypothetical protein
MTIEQLATVKRWQVLHRSHHPVEYHAWDLMLTGWVLGWIGLPVSMLLWPLRGTAVSLAMLLLPGAYCRARRGLHRIGWLRCDWLGAAR